MANVDSSVLQWYVLRCAGRQELKLKYELERHKIECFVPLVRKFHIKGSRRVSVLYPAVAGIVFGRMKTAQLAAMHEKSKIRFFTWKDCATGSPVVVPAAAMANFIGVAGTYDEQLIYLPSDTRNWQKGQRVRIMAGPFKGYEGRFVRMKGDRRIVVEIPGVIAVATGFIHPSLVEPIADDDDKK